MKKIFTVFAFTICFFYSCNKDSNELHCVEYHYLNNGDAYAVKDIYVNKEHVKIAIEEIWGIVLDDNLEYQDSIKFIKCD